MVSTIGERIRLAREAKGLTKSELQRRLGVAYTTLTAWEKDLSEPTISNAVEVASALDRTPDWVMFGEESLDDYPEVFAAWLESPTGQRATPEERDFIRGYRSLDGRKPTVESLSILLAAFRSELPVDETF